MKQINKKTIKLNTLSKRENKLLFDMYLLRSILLHLP